MWTEHGNEALVPGSTLSWQITHETTRFFAFSLVETLSFFLQVDPVVYNMLHEDPGNISYSAVGGLSDQIRELRESIELPLMNPELFLRVGIKPPKVNCVWSTMLLSVLLAFHILLFF